MKQTRLILVGGFFGEREKATLLWETAVRLMNKGAACRFDYERPSSGTCGQRVAEVVGSAGCRGSGSCFCCNF